MCIPVLLLSKHKQSQNILSIINILTVILVNFEFSLIISLSWVKQNNWTLVPYICINKLVISKCKRFIANECALKKDFLISRF